MVIQDGGPSGSATVKGVYPVNDLQPGDQVTVTLTGTIFRVPDKNGASVLIQAGKGMNDCIWLLREPGFGTVSIERTTNEVASEGSANPA